MLFRSARIERSDHRGVRVVGHGAEVVEGEGEGPGHRRTVPGASHLARTGQPRVRPMARRAMAPKAIPIAAPATTSEAWCMRVYTRLAATVAASAYHRPGRREPGARSAAAVNAAVACPEGNRR